MKRSSSHLGEPLGTEEELVRHLGYLLACVAIVLGSYALMKHIGVLSYALMAAALTFCVGFWVAG